MTFVFQVVCRQLNGSFGSPKAILLSADFTEHLVWLDNVQCNGSESRISDCVHNGWAVHNCQGGDVVAGVNCVYKGNFHYTTIFLTCIWPLLLIVDPPQFSLRLVGGSSMYEGRLQIFYNSIWGSVCDNGWDFNSARVACRQLGFADALVAVTDPDYGNAENEEVFIINNVKCSGNEPGLQYCANSGFEYHDCLVSSVAGVICTGSSINSEHG